MTNRNKWIRDMWVKETIKPIIIKRMLNLLGARKKNINLSNTRMNTNLIIFPIKK